MADDRDARIARLEAENAALRAELQHCTVERTEALEQQTATAEILRVIASTPADVPAVIQTVLEYAAQLCEAPSA